ncbi:MAG TPA: Calx-beta domain-containing protein [Pirellulaceae bacterium]|nr:Calx-beta domain-containing protein [Pirellulaceae bacterium]
MFVRTLFDSIASRLSRPPTRRAPRAAARRLAARRLLLEGLEDRRLLAFDVLAEYAAGLAPADVVLADVNSDGRPDMIVANSGGSSIDVRLGNGDGTFGVAISSATGSNPRSLAVGDFTGDGIPDVVTANGPEVSLLAGNGDGTFQLPQSISLPAQIAPDNPDPTPLPQVPQSVATGDLNADGKLDLVVAGQTSFSEYHRTLQCDYYGCWYFDYWVTHTDGYVNVLMGDGSGGFSAPEVHQLGGRSPSAIAISDLNGDGNADVVTASNYNLSTLLGNGTGALQAPIHSGSATIGRTLSLGDLDGDGHLDTIIHTGAAVYMQKGLGDGTFAPATGVSMGMAVDSAVIGDVNGDGKLDLVAVGSAFTCTSSGYYGCYDGFYRGQASVVLGNGTGSFSLPIASPLGTDFNAAFVDVALADLTGDGLPELVTIESSTGLAIVASNGGNWKAPGLLSISGVSVVEGHSGTVDAVFTVTLSAPYDAPVTVDYATADLTPDEEYWYGGPAATAGVDYIATVGTLTIPAGQVSGTITVPVNGDRVGEQNELFFVNLTNPTSAIFASSQAVGTIIDDEPYVSMDYYSNPSVVEGDAGTTPMTFTVVLSAASDAPVTVDFFTIDGSALAGSDYQATTGTMTFAPGETIQTLTVQVIGDTQQENDEYFYVNLTNATNASIGNGFKVGYILDDDTPPTIGIGDASVVEGNSGTTLMTFTVSLSNASGRGVWVNYATANGTAKTSDNDYVATSGTIYFAPGETSKTITVSIKGDTKKENDEKFYVNLSGAIGATIADSQGVGTIVNDDGGGKGNTKGSKQTSSALAVDDFMSSVRKKRSR